MNDTIPSVINSVMDEYISNTEYDQRYTSDFYDLTVKKKVIITFATGHPDSFSPSAISTLTRESIGSVYPIMRQLEQKGIIDRKSHSTYKLRFTPQVEELLQEQL